MAAVADPQPPVSPVVIAALLLVASQFLRRLKLPRPTTKQIIEATGASRSRAYELVDALLALLPPLQRPVGRPKAPPPPWPAEPTIELSRAALRFVMAHPGCVSAGPSRHTYGLPYRHFALELRRQHPDIPLEILAQAIEVPLGTFKDWWSGNTAPAQCEQTDPATAGPGCHDEGAEQTDSATAASPSSTHIETVLAAYKSWSGTFGDFCDHVRRDWRIPFGRTIISNILQAEGLRIPKRRPGRCSSDEDALRGSFETFFPGAQWVGDGTAIDVVIDGEVFTFNLELLVDAFSGGFVGISVRDYEDSAAVIEAFYDGVSTAGAPPLALLLDNRESNHTEEVDTVLGGTLRMRSTPGRAQNKAHVEGGFGLFKQTAPPIDLYTTSTHEIARQLVELQAQTWMRTVNNRPRKDRGGRTRVELYQKQPTEEQVEQARQALEERCRKQRLAQQTLEARQDPVARQLLDDTFERFSLSDPERQIRNSIACYPINAIVNGIATFEGKLNAGTLPEGAGGRYLLGIVRNLAAQDEELATAEALLRIRIDARDRMLAELLRLRDNARSAITDSLDLTKRFVDLAMGATLRIDRLFWIESIAEAIAAEPAQEHGALFRSAARRISAAFKVSHRDRLDAVRALASKIIPLG